MKRVAIKLFKSNNLNSGGMSLSVSDQGQTKRSAFTIIELLVAMAILLVIVAIVAQIFQQANVAWETGMRSVEVTMKGRSVADLIAQDLSQAIVSNYSVTATGAEFEKMGEPTAANQYQSRCLVKYDWSGPIVRRSEGPLDGSAPLVEMADGITKIEVDPSGSDLPASATVTVTVSNNMFQAKAFMQNRERYKF